MIWMFLRSDTPDSDDRLVMLCSAELNDELIVGLRCVGAEKRLKHAGQEKTNPGLID